MSENLLKNIISDLESKIDSVDLNPEIENSGEVFYL
jgi:hypothetical protein